MPYYDILSFRPSGARDTQSRRFPHGGPHYAFPNYERQGVRLNTRFQVLRDYLQGQEVLVQEQQDGIDPDNVLVFEVMGDVPNLAQTMEHIPGFRLITEEDTDAVSADDDFYEIGANQDEVAMMPRKLYASLTNRQATEQLLALWTRYSRGEGPARGETPLWNMFGQLRDVRYWDNQDRLDDTGVLEYFCDDVERGVEVVAFEVELWFYQDDNDAVEAERRVVRIIEAQGGAILNRCRYPQIGYHALAVICPVRVICEILNNHEGEILSEHSVKFLKPIGQCISVSGMDESAELDAAIAQDGLRYVTPRAAMLDGLPVENHALLQEYLIVDDPDNYQDGYMANQRKHGTAMASLIIHGDLNEHNSSISSPLYVRPICKPDENGEERIPKNELFPDLLHRVVVDMVNNLRCRDIRIVNLSLGDGGKMFAHTMSAEAKMLDYLSHTYNLLFMISAGNHLNMVEVPDMTATEFLGLPERERTRILYNQQLSYQHQQRLLAPAESFNNLTIGAIHADACQEIPWRAIDIIPNGFPSLYSAMGLGIGHGVKPSCVLPGGRQVFQSLETDARFRNYERYSMSGPGQRTANPNSITGVSYCIGTSNATALATRIGLEIYDILLNSPNLMIPTDLQALAIKTLFIHSCTWGDKGLSLKELMPNGRRSRVDVLKFIGYGMPDVDRVRGCTDERVVFVGYGSVNGGKNVEFRVPLPPCLVAQTIRKRLTVTLAWSSPLSGTMNKKQQVSLFFDSPENADRIGARLESDKNASRHGTVQHEIFEGNSAVSFIDGTELVVHVARKKDNFGASISFVLALSLEVSEGVGLPIYQQVTERIRMQTRVG